VFVAVPTLDMELMIVNVNWRPEFGDTNSSDYAELTQNITDAVSFFRLVVKFYKYFNIHILEAVTHIKKLRRISITCWFLNNLIMAIDYFSSYHR
jgi:hypothetical protein